MLKNNEFTFVPLPSLKSYSEQLFHLYNCESSFCTFSHTKLNFCKNLLVFGKKVNRRICIFFFQKNVSPVKKRHFSALRPLSCLTTSSFSAQKHLLFFLPFSKSKIFPFKCVIFNKTALIFFRIFLHFAQKNMYGFLHITYNYAI